MDKKSVSADTDKKTSPPWDMCVPAWPERDGNVLEPTLQMGFVAIGPTSDIYRVSKAFAETLKEYPKVRVLYHRTSLGRLWVVDGKPDE